jgi:VCBS repeat-containing protein
VDDTPIDTAATLVMDDGGAEAAHAGQAFAVDVHPVIGTADPAQLDIRISLLPFGSVVSDGTHSETVSETNPGVNISGWNLDAVTVTPPADQTDNFDFTLKSHPLDDPDAKWLSQDVPVVMAPGDGFPNADIGGDDRATTDEDSSVSGQLTISDADAGQDHFQAATIDGHYGRFAVDETGQWHYTPDDRADTLNAGEQANDHFAVESADGSIHQVVIGLTGTDDAPQLTATSEVGVTEGNPSGTGGTAPAPDPALADYLQYADTSQEVGAGGTADGSSSAVNDYLAAAGIDPADANGATTPDLPPTEVLIDDAAAGSTAPDADTTTADDSLAAVLVDPIDGPQVDPQHHGV